MSFNSQARAEKRVLFSGALTGAGLGLGLGAFFMVVGMADAVTSHSNVSRIARGADGHFSESVLKAETAALDPGVMRLARPLDPHAVDGAARKIDALDVRLAEAPPRIDRRLSGLDGDRELECLTQAVYFEARGETSAGQAAVAQVVLNRVDHPAFPKSVCGVVYQGCQFSFACDGSTRARRESGAWSRARKVAARAMAGVVLSDVGNATHFHTTHVSPNWGPRMRQVAQVGLHVFYSFRRHPGAPARQAPAAEPQVTLVSMDVDAAAPMSLEGRLIAPTAKPDAAAPVATDAVAPAPAETTPAAAPPKPVETKVTAAQSTLTGSIEQ